MTYSKNSFKEDKDKTPCHSKTSIIDLRDGESDHLGIDGTSFRMKVTNRIQKGGIFTYDFYDSILIYTDEDYEQKDDDGYYVYEFRIFSKNKSDFYPKNKTIGTELFQIKNSMGE